MRGLLQFLAKYHVMFLFFILELVALILLSSNNSFHSAKIYGINYSISSRMANRFTGFSQLKKIKEQNKALVEENTRLYNALANNYLTDDPVAIDTLGTRHYYYIPAKVINNSVSKQFNFITIDKGRIHGLKPEMGVICNDGIVGVIKEVSTHFSSVIPVLNRDYFPNARIKNSDFFGYIEWPGINYQKVLLQEIPQHAAVTIGDSIVTSGYSAVFPENIMIGSVTDYKITEGVQYEIEVKLSTDFKKLGHVMVIKNILQEEQKLIEEVSSDD